MAGIGFELKKIYRGGVFNALKGTFYSSLTTVGPQIMIISVLLLMYIVINYADSTTGERDLMASVILYCFIFSFILTSPVNAILSRYIADRIYEEKFDDVLASYHVGLFINIVLVSALAIPFVLRMYFVGKVDAVYTFFSYYLFITLVFTFFSMTYITALKEYRKISLTFLVGMSATLVSALVMSNIFHIQSYRVFVFAYAIGFTITAMWLFILVKSFFKVSSDNYKETLSYFGKYKLLFFTNLFYCLGLYAHNFVFWTTENRLVVANCFVSAPVYDMASCIAVFINISTIVIFVVQVETAFHERYVEYCEATIDGTVNEVLTAKNKLLSTMEYKLIYIVQQQILINVVLYFIAIVTLPRISVNGLVLEILPSLAVAYFAIFAMYAVIVYLYYFEDYKGAFYTTVIFMVVSVAGSFYSTTLRPSLYGLGLFAGALIAFVFSYIRLCYIGNKLNHHIYCRGNIVETVYKD